MMRTDLDVLCVQAGSAIRDAIVQMNRNHLGIVLVVEGDRRLLGTITDGDIRRAILASVDLRQVVTVLLERKQGTPFAQPITAPLGADRSTYLNLLQQYSALHLPILDQGGRVAGLVSLTDLLPEHVLPLRAVVMAGGAGKRLYPLTEDTPKPMLQVGDKPLLEIIIKQLRQAGITEVKMSLHHQPEKITSYFGNGKEFGVELSYVTEDQPLGTVGSLSLLEPPKETTLVMNGDVLTQVDFRAMLIYHREHHADLTMAVRPREFNVPYGIIECDGPLVKVLQEKPVLHFFVNAGIYLLEPSVYRYIPNGQRCDMTELIQSLLNDGRPVASFPIQEYWADIGDHACYAQAQHDVKSWAAEGDA